MSDNLKRGANSVYLAAIAAILAPAAATFGAYGAANTYDLNPAGYTESNAYGSVGSIQYGTGKTSGFKTALTWTGTSGSFTTLNPAGMTESYILGAVPGQQVGAAYGVSTSSTDNAFIWNGSAASAVNINPAGYVLSYALATDGVHQAGYGHTSSGIDHALMWSGTAASFVDLHPSSGYTVSYAFGVGGTQQVGYGSTPKVQGNTFDHALLWTGTAASVVDLHPASGFTGTYAYAAVDNKQYGFGWGSSTGNFNHALAWSGTAASVVDMHPTSTSVAYPTVYNQTKIFSAFDTRQVGWAWSTTNQEHAVVWSGTAASAVDLHLLLPGAPTKSFARSVDVYGNVTGEAYYSGVQHAVAWLAGNTYKIAGGTGAWNSTSNWLSSTIPTTSQDILLLQSDASNRTITYASASNPTLGKLTIDATGSGSMTLAQSQDSLTFANEFIGFVGKGTFNHSGGTHNVTGTLTLATRSGSQGNYNLSGAASLTANNLVINAGGTFTQTGGTLNAATTLNAGVLTLGGGGSTANIGSLDANISGTTSAQLASVGTTSISANGNVTATRLRQSSLAIHGAAGSDTAKLTITESSPTHIAQPTYPAGSNASVSIVKSLTIDNNSAGTYFGTLDITNNDLIIDYTDTGVSPLSTIEAMVKSGYNSGSWTGKGITSTVAQFRPDLFTVAVADNTMLGGAGIGAFDDINTSNHKQVLVKFTWIADINLDGVVDSNDAFAFGNQYIEGLTGVHHLTDDLNYDGVVDSNDAFLFGNAYNEALQHLPEPTSLSIMALGALALLKRRRS